MNEGAPVVHDRRAWFMRLAGLVWVAVLVWALFELHKEWSGFHFAELRAALARIGLKHLTLAFGFTVASYLCNAALGLIAQRWLKHPPVHPLRDLAHNFIVSAFTMNAGGSVLGGGSIRLRFAAENGISAAEVGKATAFSAAAGWAGHALLCGVLLCFATPDLSWVPGHVSRGVGAVLLVVGLLLPFGALVSNAWPRPALAWLTMAASVLDWFFAGMVMWALFPGALPMGALSLVAVVAVAQALASLTHVPGGIGVLELSMTKALAGVVAAPVLAGTLVTYRLVYYLLPFALGIVILGMRELMLRREALGKGSRIVRHGWTMIAPRLASWLALGGGFLLLLSANTPIAGERRGIVGLLPLPFVEASHFISSLTGALLIVLARGLQRRVQAAWWLAVVAMAGGIVFSLPKGWDWEEALILGFMLLCLLTTRSYFHRHASLWSHRFTAGWWLMLAALLGVALWVGFFATRHVPYQENLWWKFALEGDASRFLRAALGAGCVFLIALVAQALRPSASAVAETPLDAARIRTLVSNSSYSAAALALLGDKRFTFSEDALCSLMYADQGRSRIVLGDPLGDSDAADDMLWNFVEQAGDEGMRPVFYQVSVREMPRLVDMGFKLYKLGEEAIVPLADFTLDGADAKKLRQTRSRFQRSGLTFAIWPPEVVQERMATLKAISDAWLVEHRAGEKGFSLGRFDPVYLAHFPCAVVLDASQRVLAFANLWMTADKNEVSVDLMRHLPDAPNGVMESLFIEIMLWGKEQGYGGFNLGMAPLSGLSTHPLAPLWHKLAAGIFHRGGHFYNFTGLRAYKEKFKPRWEPRYIAVASRWHLPSALLDATALIGGGWRQTFIRKST